MTDDSGSGKKKTGKGKDGLISALSGQGGRGQGVRRLNRLPLLIGFGIALLIGGVILYTLYQKSHPAVATAANGPSAGGVSAEIPETMRGAPTQGEIHETNEVPTPTPAAPQPVAAAVPVPAAPAQQPLPAAQSTMSTADLERLHRANATALTASSSVTLQNGAMHPQAQATPSQQSSSGSSSRGDAAANLASALAAARGKSTDPNGQSEKNDFLSKTSSSDADTDYLKHTREAPASDTDVKAGTVIPATLISGLNSDLPGQIIAQVRENVYDTATGRRIIIPQGSRLVGSYDSRVARGQSRALTVWRRIIFPDASSVNIESMPGSDQAGFAGFHDLVDEHDWRVIKDALLISVFSAGIQLSQPQQQTGQLTNQQIASAALGQELGQVGMQYAQRDIDIQPTLEIRPGYRFNVMVTKDMVIPAWAHTGH